MTCLDPLEGRSFASIAELGKFQSRGFLKLISKTRSHDQTLRGIFKQDVVKVVMDCDREICRQGPGSRCPDHDTQRLVVR